MEKYSSKNKNVIFNTEFLQLKQIEYNYGKMWVYAHRPNAKNIVVIIPLLFEKNEKYTIFLTTKRPPLTAEGKADFCVEFPAGLVGDENKDETVEKAIYKELEEETGYHADKFSICAPLVSSSSGCTSETSVMVIAEILKNKIYKSPISDGGIIQNIHKININDIDNWVLSMQNKGFAISSQALAGLYFLNNYLKNNVNIC